MKHKLKHIEKTHGKPIKEVLIEFYEKYGEQQAVARALGVSQPILSIWLIKLGLKEHKILKEVRN